MSAKQLSWKDVISAERYVHETEGRKTSKKQSALTPPADSGADDKNPKSEAPVYGNTDLQRDVDRIVFSSAFRRMQGKAQVYIAPQSDYVRNRLTHTLEVVSIARSLASQVFVKLEENDNDFKAATKQVGKPPIRKRELVEAVAAASHMHDIGNPPFGHIGEYAISSWFKEKDALGTTLRSTHPKLYDILQMQRDEFSHFDGNPQGFRIVSQLCGWRKEGGLRLTYLTLASSIKYPWSAKNAPETKKNKFGYFESEAHIFSKVFERLKLCQTKDKITSFVRHPFSYLMEAADDIAYVGSDIEDGFKQGLIPKEEAVKSLENLGRWCLEKLGTKYKNMERNVRARKQPISDQVKYLRSAVTESLIVVCREIFMERYADMLRGEFKGSLIDNAELSKAGKDYKTKEAYEAAKNLSRKYVYNSKAKTVNEQGAYQIVRFMLDEYSNAVEEYLQVKGTGWKRKLNEKSENALTNMHRIYDAADLTDEIESNEDKNRVNFRIKSIKDMSPINQYRTMIDFISGMTDAHAIRLSRTMRGGTIGTR
jgi:dGTPase